MLSKRFGAAIVICGVVVLGAAGGAAQELPDLYTLVNVGAVPAPACVCIGSPLALPAFRPRRSVHHGSATPPDDPRDDSFVHPDAAMFRAFRYIRGLGVAQSDQAAAFWFYDAAQRGDNAAMVALGLLYAAGRGIPQDWSAAVWWWQRARPTMPLAARLLGDAYACGLGVTPDSERAVAMYKKAVEGGDVSASIHLGHMYTNRCAPPDDEAAVAAYRRAADEGFPEAQVALSDLIRSGRGVTPNAAEAYHWARLAELRTPPGDLRQRAAAAVKAAARLMSQQEIAAAEQMAQVMIAEASKPR